MDMIAMSGGVDSSVALLLTKEKLGRDVLGVTLSLTEPRDEQALLDAKAVCDRVGVRHEVVFAEKEFRESVIDYFANEYFAGRTPNPCVICNREIKFGLLSRLASERGFEKIITGHYARVANVGAYSYIRVAKDAAKDQSYMLAFLTQEQIRRAVFPLGEYTKTEVREIAGEHGFANAHKKDSQDVCFVPDGDYVAAIERITGKTPEKGVYVDETGKILGEHKGYWCYTIGQRKGLGIALGKHAFVLSKDAQTNRVVLGDEPSLFQRFVNVTDLHFPGEKSLLEKDARCMAKIRYAHRAATCCFHQTSECEGVIEFAEPQRAPSPGQFAVLYDESGEYIIGAGKIGDMNRV